MLEKEIFHTFNDINIFQMRKILDSIIFIYFFFFFHKYYSVIQTY